MSQNANFATWDMTELLVGGKVMEKTINIGNKPVRLTNNVSWTMIYRDQFGQDIIPSLMPAIAAVLDVISGIVRETGKTSGIEIEDLIAVLDGDSLIDAVIHMSGLEFTDLIKMTWAMAKAVDDNLPEPKVWVKEFEVFPIDEVAPAMFELAVTGVMSSKNLARLKNLTASLQPALTSIQSSLQDSKED